MNDGREFNKYATKHLGISSLNLNRFDPPKPQNP